MNTTTTALSEVGAPSGYGRRMASGDYRRRVLAVGQLFESATRGDRYARLEFHDLMGGRRAVREALSTSDFPILFGDFLNRSLASRYAVAAPVWNQFAARRIVRDFRPSKIIDFYGAAGVLDKVRQLEEYNARGLSESKFETTLAKYGNRLAWAWENSINDDLGAFDNAPNALATAAVATEDYLATSALCDASGPLPWLGTAGTAALTGDNLEAGLQTILDVVDEDGNPIEVGTPVLMVPMALAQTAQNIINTTEIRATASSKERRTTGNGLTVTPRVVVNRWLTVIDKSATAKTTWYLLPEPTSARPAVIQNFLAGYEAPDLRVKADGGMRLGGGAVDPTEGSFERDSVEYRIRHVVGGNKAFDDAVYVSKGA